MRSPYPEPLVVKLPKSAFGSFARSSTSISRFAAEIEFATAMRTSSLLVQRGQALTSMSKVLASRVAHGTVEVAA